MGFKPTEEQRRSVRTMSGYGVNQDDIAMVLAIDPKTLRKYFRQELDEGLATGNVKIGQSLFEMGVGRPAQYDEEGRMLREELKPDKSAAIFLGKARLGLRDTQRIEHTGQVNHGQAIDIDLSVLDDEELATFMRLYEKARRLAREAEAAAAEPLRIGGHSEA